MKYLNNARCIITKKWSFQLGTIGCSFLLKKTIKSNIFRFKKQSKGLPNLSNKKIVYNCMLLVAMHLLEEKRRFAKRNYNSEFKNKICMITFCGFLAHISSWRATGFKFLRWVYNWRQHVNCWTFLDGHLCYITCMFLLIMLFL